MSQTKPPKAKLTKPKRVRLCIDLEAYPDVKKGMKDIKKLQRNVDATVHVIKALRDYSRKG